jgi:uncharacterized membrane protein
MSMSHDDDNPFAPPKAAVLEAQASEAGEYVPDGQKVATSHGIEWFTQGWDLFTKAPGMWVGLFLVFIVLWFALAIVPLGSLAESIIYPAIVAGVMLGCRGLEEGRPLELAHLFAGFQKNAGNLLLVGLLYLVGVFVIVIVTGIVAALIIPLVASGKMKTDDFSGVLAMAPFFVLVVLVVLALMLPLIMALWFAPALIVFHDVQPMAAMRSSFQGCLRNFVPFLLYGLIGLVLFFLAILPLGLGLLILGPVMWGSMYAGYRDIFVRPA